MKTCECTPILASPGNKPLQLRVYICEDCGRLFVKFRQQPLMRLDNLIHCLPSSADTVLSCLCKKHQKMAKEYIDRVLNSVV